MTPEVDTAGAALTFQLTVTDNGGLKSTDQCSVTANNLNSGIDLTGFWLELEHIPGGSRHWIRGILEVENLGNQTSPPTFVQFYLSTDNTIDETDKLISGRRIYALEPGQTIKVPLKKNLSYFETGSYIIAVVDPTKLVPEIDEINNFIFSWPLN